MKMINSLPMFLLAANLAFPALAQSPGASCSPDGQSLTMKSGTLYGVHLICSGGVWTIAGFQVGNATDSCAAEVVGTIRWNSPNLEYCNGSSWVTVGASTSNVQCSGSLWNGWGVSCVNITTGRFCYATDSVSNWICNTPSGFSVGAGVIQCSGDKYYGYITSICVNITTGKWCYVDSSVSSWTCRNAASFSP
jgi:hypothetical protein